MSSVDYGTPEQLLELWSSGGLADSGTESLEVAEACVDFDDYWEPFTAGVGPGGGWCASLSEDQRAALREECRRRLGDGELALRARAWAVRGRA